MVKARVADSRVDWLRLQKVSVMRSSRLGVAVEQAAAPPMQQCPVMTQGSPLVWVRRLGLG